MDMCAREYGPVLPHTHPLHRGVVNVVAIGGCVGFAGVEAIARVHPGPRDEPSEDDDQGAWKVGEAGYSGAPGVEGGVYLWEGREEAIPGGVAATWEEEEEGGIFVEHDRQTG
ncbi:uncharacterized protein BCR38DRAFT_408030 [Pseudomassariella vexata]|uniref:Uncharacterized protein n=1 Tax=Pseudomassariella vexata TaxID=1141098 RepID=A0A1Y2E5B7_9PEZI|nr:uncharacterized protein BCR38DRAFT_408030 [Pseudomassariella vexata]ORY66055.1 hypothetical protein BCR38DRAFT_408030 [Pseudomassariella vexata]